MLKKKKPVKEMGGAEKLREKGKKRLIQMQSNAPN